MEIKSLKHSAKCNGIIASWEGDDDLLPAFAIHCTEQKYTFQHGFKLIQLTIPDCQMRLIRDQQEGLGGKSDQYLLINKYIDQFYPGENVVDSENNTRGFRLMWPDYGNNMIEWLDGARYRVVPFKEYIEYDFEAYFNDCELYMEGVEPPIYNRNISYLIEHFDIKMRGHRTLFDAVRDFMTKDKFKVALRKLELQINNRDKRKKNQLR
jgi:hypothetical protein